MGRIHGAYGQPYDLADVATRVGWHGGVFVLPGRIVGSAEPARKVWIHLGDERRERFDRYRAAGTLKGFRTIARLAAGNSRFMLLVCLSFTGPVAALLAAEQPGVMLVGDAGTWKTTLLVAAASAWGRHADPNMANKLGFCLPLNATVNDLEDEALAANFTLLAVDETRAADGDGDGDESKVAAVVVGAVMRWETGFEKGRKTGTGPRRSASVPFALTSNRGLGALAALAGRKVDDAHHGRLVGVPLPARGVGGFVFERLHGHADPAALGAELRRLGKEHHGVASVEFLCLLAGRRAEDEARLLRWLGERRAFYLGRAVYIDARGHVELVERERGSTGPAVDPLGLLRAHVREHRAAFVDLRKGGLTDISDHDHDACPGYVNKHKRCGEEYLFPEAALQKVVGAAAEARRLKKELVRRGEIDTAAGGGDRYSLKRPIGRHANGKPDRRHVVAIRSAALD